MAMGFQTIAQPNHVDWNFSVRVSLRQTGVPRYVYRVLSPLGRNSGSLGYRTLRLQRGVTHGRDYNLIYI
jgi:hypothetical protein